MPSNKPIQDELRPESAAFYRHALQALKKAGVPFLLGGAYALHRYTGIVRHTKDLDVFVRPADFPATLDVLSAAGYRTEVTDPIWLGKAFFGEDYVDVIYGSGKGVAQVDDGWFEYAVPDEVLGEKVGLIPVEEMIWSKAFVMERERYDGADIAHLIRSCGPRMNWQRLLDRFGVHWRVLYSYLILFGFIYPAEQDNIPGWVLDELACRLQAERSGTPATDHVCQGTLLSVAQFRMDVSHWGYADGRPPFAISDS